MVVFTIVSAKTKVSRIRVPTLIEAKKLGSFLDLQDSMQLYYEFLR